MDRRGVPILVVDDDTGVRDFLQQLLIRQGYQTESAPDANTALVMMQQKQFPLALIDVKMPGVDGLSLLRQMRQAEVDTEVIILTGYGTVENAVEAMKLGAYDYMTKPPDSVKLCLVVGKALERAGLQRQNVHLRMALAKQSAQAKLVGNSPVMQQIRQLIAQVAAVDSTVLIQGSTGTGKELVARSIHEQSSRRSDLFLALNCATIPETLLGSELFGHERNAFTGADQAKVGIFEAADRGTIFLDELSEMPPPMQASLLRTLESGEFRRVGSNNVRFTQARVIAATNKELPEEVEAKRFRRDLYYRLNVFTISLPPLTARQDDIPFLAHHFLMENVRRYGKMIRGFTEEAIRVMSAYEWPGNVRELRNVVERAALLCQQEEITAADLILTMGFAHVPAADYSPSWTLDEVERHHIQQAFARNKGHREVTASELGISVRTLYRKLRRYGIIDEE